MSKNIKLMLGASTVAVYAIAVLQGCGSDDTSGGTTPTAGSPSAGATAHAGAATAGATTTAGAPGAGATNGGAGGAGGGDGVAGTPTAGASGAAGAGGAATTAGAGGAAGAAGAGGSKGGAGGAAGASGAAGAGGSKGGAGGAAGASGAAGTGGGSAGAGGGDGRDCTTFCADETATCATMAYATPAACMTACTGFTLGMVSSLPAGPTVGDTYACRRYHLSAAAMGDGSVLAGNKTTHCPHTGLISKNAYSDATATGPCKN